MSTTVKLVRDDIPDLIASKGERVPAYRKNFGNGGEQHLWNKLEEEKQEFLQAESKEARVEELADMMEVIYGLAHRYGIERQHLDSVCAKKYVERGGFEEGIIMAIEKLCGACGKPWRNPVKGSTATICFECDPL